MITLTLRFRPTQQNDPLTVKFAVIRHDQNEIRWHELRNLQSWAAHHSPNANPEDERRSLREELWRRLQSRVFDGVANAASPKDTRINTLGANLFSILFDAYGPNTKALKLFRDTFRWQDGDRPPLACLVIDVDPDLSPLLRLPWEVLLDPRHGVSLHDRRIAVVRSLKALPVVGSAELRPVPKRLIFYGSDETANGLDWKTELHAITKCVSRLGVSVEHRHSLGEGPPSQAQGVPSIVSVVCHGKLEEREFRLQTRRARLLQKAETIHVARFIEQLPKCTLLFINACHGAEVPNDGQPFGRFQTVQQLADSTNRADFVLTNAWSVDDGNAVRFAEAFYTCLCTNDSFLTSLWRGREAVKAAAPDALDWSFPVAYVRCANDFVLDTRPKPIRRAELGTRPPNTSQTK